MLEVYTTQDVIESVPDHIGHFESDFNSRWRIGLHIFLTPNANHTGAADKQ